MSLWGPGVLVALVGFAYARLVLARNRNLVPPPVLGIDGRPLREHTLTLSGGEEVTFVDAGPGNRDREHDEPDRPTVLMLPGADGIKETFRFQIPALASRYRVVSATLRSRFAQDDTLDRMVADALELADRVTEGPLILVGQSLGGAIAMRFTVLHPERVQALVVCNSLARISYEHVRLNRALLTPVAIATTRYLPTVLGRALARLWSRLEVWIYDASPGSERVIDYAMWTGPRTVPSSVSGARVDLLKATDLRPQLAAVRVPTLVLKGPRDHYVPPAWSHEIAALIPGARYEEIPGTGHCSHVSMPAGFNHLLLNWLDGTTRGGRARTPASALENVE